MTAQRAWVYDDHVAGRQVLRDLAYGAALVVQNEQGHQITVEVFNNSDVVIASLKSKYTRDEWALGHLEDLGPCPHCGQAREGQVFIVDSCASELKIRAVAFDKVYGPIEITPDRVKG